MKTGENKKKLVLNKISIVQLDNDKIHEVKTGLPLIEGGILVETGGKEATCKTNDGPPCPIYT